MNMCLTKYELIFIIKPIGVAPVLAFAAHLALPLILSASKYFNHVQFQGMKWKVPNNNYSMIGPVLNFCKSLSYYHRQVI